MEKSIKKLEELNLIDDFLMNEMVLNKKYGLEFVDYFLKVVLGQKVKIKEIKVQAVATPGKYENRAIRMDILTEADLQEANVIIDNYMMNDFQERDYSTAIDIEMQANNNLTGPGKDNDIRRRSRLYQSLIDRGLLPTGSEFGDLDNVMIIICTPFDVFGDGRCKYTFTNICLENPKLKLNDGAYRIFLNTKGEIGGSDELIELLQYIETSNISNAKNESLKKIHTMVTEVIQSDETRVLYMKLNMKLHEVDAKARKETKKEEEKKWQKVVAEKDAIISDLQKKLMKKEELNY